MKGFFYNLQIELFVTFHISLPRVTIFQLSPVLYFISLATNVISASSFFILLLSLFPALNYSITFLCFSRNTHSPFNVKMMIFYFQQNRQLLLSYQKLNCSTFSQLSFKSQFECLSTCCDIVEVQQIITRVILNLKYQ